MLYKDKIIAVYCIVDDLLKAIAHKEDVQKKVSGSEVITTVSCIDTILWRSSGQNQAVYEDNKARSLYTGSESFQPASA